MRAVPMAGILLVLLACVLLAPAVRAQTTLHGFQGSTPGEAHGYSVANAGDVDADGFDDIVVGSPFYDRFVFPSQILPDAGRAVVRSGATGAVLISGIGGAAGHRLGFDVDGAGDVNNDGFDDVIVGTPGKQAGSFTVFFGPDGQVALETTSTFGAPFGFGTSVAGCGDANADGFDDVVTGAPYTSTVQGLETGMVYVYDVMHQQVIALASGTEAEAHLGWSVDGAGDVDGDGRADVIVGEPHRDSKLPGFPVFNDSGRAVVFSTSMNDMPILLSLPGDFVNGTEAGYSVAGAGLVNGDGVPDFFVGAPGTNSGTGAVSLRSGLSGALITSYDGAFAGERFGTAVGGGGDFNADGLLDVIVGAPSYDVPPFGLNRGRIEVRSALSGVVLHTASSLSGGEIGFAVDIGAKTDLDGRDEIIYGAPSNDSAASNAGASWVVSSSDFLTAVGFYGSAFPGTLGEPDISISGSPSIGANVSILLESSAPAIVPAVLAAGFAPLALSFYGGTLLVDPHLTLQLNLAPGSSALPIMLPDETQFLGLNIYLQLWQVDAGAPHGVALSRGMHLVLGN